MLFAANDTLYTLCMQFRCIIIVIDDIKILLPFIY